MRTTLYCHAIVFIGIIIDATTAKCKNKNPHLVNYLDNSYILYKLSKTLVSLLSLFCY